MEDGESGNSERKNSNLRSARNQSIRFYFFAFLLIFGWEGPFSIYLGLRDGSVALVMVGLFITVFLWGLFGIEELKKFLKDLRR
jgi:RsiW-degrading membrane proteinase PrsW (M82 family)